MRSRFGLILVAFLIFGSKPSSATTDSYSFGVTVTIAADCNFLLFDASLDFGTIGVTEVNYDDTASFTVQCTSATEYDLGIDDGNFNGGVSDRRMNGPSTTLLYQLFRDSAHTQNWGETIDTDTVSGTGDGTAQSYTIYGRIPIQITPIVGTYTDEVNIIITY